MQRGSIVTGELHLKAHNRQSYDIFLTLTAPPEQPDGEPQKVGPTSQQDVCVVCMQCTLSTAWLLCCSNSLGLLPHTQACHVLQASGKYDLKNPFYRQLTQSYMPTQAYASDMQSTGLPEADAGAGYEGQDPTQQAWLYQQAQTQQQVQQASPAHQWPGEPV